MVTTIQTNIYKVTLLLLLALCLGSTSKLYAVGQNDAVAEKEGNAPNHNVDGKQALMPAWDGTLGTCSAFQIYLLLDNLVFPAVLISAKTGPREGLKKNQHKILQYVLSSNLDGAKVSTIKRKDFANAIEQAIGYKSKALLSKIHKTLRSSDLYRDWQHKVKNQKIKINISFNLYASHPNYKLVLPLDELIAMFPNITELVCTHTHYIGMAHHGKQELSTPPIANASFMAHLIGQVTRNKAAKLEKITIQHHESTIAHHVDLLVGQFAAIGWDIAIDHTYYLSGNCKAATITLTKTAQGVNWKKIIKKGVIPQIESIIAGAYAIDSTLTGASSIGLLKQLTTSSKNISPDVQQIWDKFRLAQQHITINMKWMHMHYKEFIPLFFAYNPQFGHVLHLDKIIKIFPNAATITIIPQYQFETNAILGLKKVASQAAKHKNLKKVIMTTGELDKISTVVYDSSHPKELNQTLWKAIRDQYVMPKITRMIKGERLRHNEIITSGDVAFLTGKMDIPADLALLRDTFKNEQKTIKIDIKRMYEYYTPFLELFVDTNSKIPNLLRLEEIVKIFPNATEIISVVSDYIRGRYLLSTAVVNPALLTAVRNLAIKTSKSSHLNKVTIQTSRYPVSEGCGLDVMACYHLGWKVSKDNQKEVSFTKISDNESRDDILKNIISRGVGLKILPMIKKNSSTKGNLTTASVMRLLNQLMKKDNNLPKACQGEWEQYRHERKIIKVDMQRIYKRYRLCIPLLFSSSIKNLLLLDKIVKMFPNITTIRCYNADYLARNKKDDKKRLHSLMVNSMFMGKVKEMLTNIVKNKPKQLVKITIHTKKYTIADECKLYPTAFEALGWKVQKSIYKQVISLTKLGSDPMYQDVITKVECMVKAEQASYKASYLDVSIFKELIWGAKDISADVQKKWYTFRHEQQSITIDMKDMYRYYNPFMPLLFDSKLQHLLLLDKIVQIFPKVTEIICKNTDYVDKDAKEYIPDKYGASFTIVCSHFILGVKESLSKLDKDAQLTKIVIETKKHEVGDDCKLYATAFEKLGWQVQKSIYKHVISITKVVSDAMYKDVIAKIDLMINEQYASYQTTALDVSIFNKLIVGVKDISADLQKKWLDLRHQQRITIDIEYMYKYYKALIPLLFNANCTNLLLLGKIAKLFPSVTEIICEKTDLIDGNGNKDNKELENYSSDIVNSNFILGIKACLSKMGKQAKLTKIVLKTKEHKVGDDCKLHATAFEALGWWVRKAIHKKAISVTKLGSDAMYKDVITKIKFMINAQRPSYATTALDVSIFNKLIVGGKHISADVQKEWEAFKKPQQYITIDMKYIYKYYKAFMPLLFDQQCTNLLLLDKIVQLFPNVTELTCEETDLIDGNGNKDTKEWETYSSDIVNSNFILGLIGQLGKIDKHSKLTKIVIKTVDFIKDSCKLYTPQFGALGWKIEIESWDDEHNKYFQITLTRPKAPKASAKLPPAKADANENNCNDYQAADNDILDID